METKRSVRAKEGFEQRYDVQLESLKMLIAGSNLSIHQKQRLEDELRNHDCIVRDEIRRLQEQSGLDSLTGLLNMKTFSEKAMKYFSHRRRSHDLTRGMHLALGMIDIRNFKFLNDHHGHEAGDEVLTMLATVLRVNSREGDLLARRGGDEFCYLFIADSKYAIEITDRLKFQIDSAMIDLGNRHGWVRGPADGDAGRIDVGLACFEKGHTPISKTDAQSILKALMGHADNNMYISKGSVKRGGRDQLTVSHFKLMDGKLEQFDPLVLSL